MKPTEAAILLTIAAAYDNRKPDPDQAKAWAMVLDGLRFEDCRTVVVEHFKRSREWMMPVDVIAGVKRLRTQRLLDFGPIPAPEHLDADSPTFDRDYAAYMADKTRAIADGELRREDVPEPDAIGPRRDVIAELGQARSVDAALASKPSREALDRARREKQAADAARKRAEDARRAELERMRREDQAAREQVRGRRETAVRRTCGCGPNDPPCQAVPGGQGGHLYGDGTPGRETEEES